MHKKLRSVLLWASAGFVFAGAMVAGAQTGAPPNPKLAVVRAGGNATVTWNATVAARADLEHSPNLSSWTTVSANNTAGSFNHAVGTATRGFYRLRIQTAPFPIIGLSGNLSFGSATVNSTANRTLSISNTGVGNLTVQSIAFPPGFTGNFSGTIAAGATRNVTVSFTPVRVEIYGGNLTIVSDAQSGPGEIACSGSGVPADADNDGATDYREALDGTDPHDPTSFKPLSKGLVAYYPFNGNANDESGYGNNGEVRGAALAPDRFGEASSVYGFPGDASIDAHLDMGRPHYLQFAGDFTATGWAKFSEGVTNPRVLSYGQESGFEILTHGIGRHRKFRAHGGAALFGAKGYPENQWHMVAIVKDGDNFALYVNGSYSVSSVATHPLRYAQNFQIGKKSEHWNDFFGGRIDDIRIYNRALTATELSQLFAEESGGPNMALVPGGSGNATVPGFHIARFETTWGEWKKVRAWAAANGYDIANEGEGTADNHPVASVGWHAAAKWCNAKSEMEGLAPVYRLAGAVFRSGAGEPALNANANGYRLPTEAEWQWAASGGGQGSTYSGGNDLNAVAWYAGNSNGGTKPVGTKAANALGVFDMAGNVGEWCAAAESPFRSIRGGWWGESNSTAFAVSTPGAASAPAHGTGFRYARNAIDDLVPVRGGTLPGSSELAGRRVPAFLIGKHEVTWEKWQEVRAWAVENGYSDMAGVGAGSAGGHPVRGVGWNDAVKWSNARSEMEGLAPVYHVDGEPYKTGQNPPPADRAANGYRLPAEAEWEWAARGGEASQGFPYSGGNTADPVAWHFGNSNGAPVDLGGGRGTWPAGQKTPNELGLFDMGGNVREWCEDASDAPLRRSRGGSWADPEVSCLVADRGNQTADALGDSATGFRLARNTGPKIAFGGALPDAARNEPYGFTFGVGGDNAPVAWSIAGGTLPPGLSFNAATATISGTPTALGNYTYRIRLDSGANWDEVEIRHRVILPRTISLSGNLSFGIATVDTISNRTLSITNTGTGNLTVRSIAYSDPAFSGNFSGTVAPGATRNVAVSFRPDSERPFACEIMVDSDSTSGNSTIDATGSGLHTRIIGLSGNLSFGIATVNTTINRTLSITNTGTGNLTVDSISYPAGFSGNFSGTVAPGATQNVTLSFTPTSAQIYGGNLSVVSNASSGPSSLLLSGTGVATLAVAYDTQGGSPIASGSTTIGGSIEATPGTPTRAGYTFNGWFTAATGGNAVSFPYAHGHAGNFTLYAQWSANSFGVVYDGQGGVLAAVLSRNATLNTTPSGTVFSFPQFDSGLGTLTGVDLQLNSSFASGEIALVGQGEDYELTGIFARLRTSGSGLPNQHTNMVALSASPSIPNSQSGYSTQVYALAGSQPLISSAQTYSINSSHWGSYQNPGGAGNTPNFTSRVFASLSISSAVPPIADTSSLAAASSYTLRYTYTPANPAPQPGQGNAIANGTTTTGGSIVASPGTPIRDGYTFNGWFTAPGGGSLVSFPYAHGQTGNFTLYAQWTPNALAVVYDTQGGSAVANGTTTTGGSIASSPGTPIRSGYTFNGWFASSTGGSAISFPYTHGRTGNFTLYAQWTANTLAVAFDTQGGSAISNGTTTTGGSIAATPGTPVREGYSFKGWFTAATGGTQVSFPYAHGQTGDFTLYAQWDFSTLSVVYDSQGGSATQGGVTMIGASIESAPLVPTRDGYTFNGWYSAPSGGRAISFPYEHGQTGNFTLFAQWTGNILLVSYDGQGGAAPPSLSHDAILALTNSATTFSFPQFDATLGTLTAVQLFINPSEFGGGASITNNSGEAIVIDAFRSRAQVSGTGFTTISTTNTIAGGVLPSVVGGYALNGGATQFFTIPSTSLLGLPSTISISSGSFASYIGSGSTPNFTARLINYLSSYTADPHDLANSFSISAPNTILTLRYTYTPTNPVQEPIQGGFIATGTTTTGGSIWSPPGTPARAGYTFNGWFASPTGGSAISFPHSHGQTANFTLYAQWTPNDLAVTYDSQGGSAVASGTTTTGASIADAPATPTRAGYAFNGWFASPVGGTAISFPYAHGQTGNFTLYAQWSGTRIIGLSGNLSFGGATVNTTSNRTLSISNTGTGNLTVNSISYPAGFSGNFSGTVAPGATQNVTVSFRPDNEGNFGGNITVNSTATAGNSTISASGTGAHTRIIGLSGNLSFSGATVNTTSNRTLSITNTGTGNLTVNSISYPAGFSGNFAGAIAPGATQNVTVSFRPDNEGAFGGNITVNSTATSGNGTIAASGTGAHTRIVALSGNLSFGIAAVNSTTNATLSIANTGTGNLTVSSISYPAGFSGNFSGTVAPGATQNVTVSFSPTVVQSYGGNITVVSNATSGTGVLGCSGNAVEGMVLVQGSEDLQAFQIGRTEVTWDEWRDVRTWAEVNGYGDLANVGAGSAGNHPVQQVSWYDVLKWSNARSEMEGLTPVYSVNGTVYRAGEFDPNASDIVVVNNAVNGYRLPTQAEWEWAASAGGQGFTYSGSNDLSAVAWHWDNSFGAEVDLFDGRGTWPVAQKAANELGIHDMTGNVWEWCWDFHDTYSRRIRGGSWWNNSVGDYIVAFPGYGCSPNVRSNNDIGFRLVRSVGPKISINGTVLNAVLDQPYALAFGVAGGNGTNSWSVSEGTPPPGMSLNANTGLLGGTPIAVGTYTFVVRLESGGYWDEVEVEINVFVASFNWVTTLAGSGGFGSVDGQGVEASFSRPWGMAIDSNQNLYVADMIDHKIRKISPSGFVSTLAGSGEAGYEDGVGASASFNIPMDVAVDVFGNVYVADALNNRIRKITPSGSVSTLAGSGIEGFADGLGSEASFNKPNGIAVDSDGNVYVGDSSNHRVRKISPNGLVSTLAGTGDRGFGDGSGADASFNAPTGLAVDAYGNVYVADSNGMRIRKITPEGNVSTIAGSGIAGYVDAQGTEASFNFPHDVAVDNFGNVYVIEYFIHLIRRIESSGLVSTFAGYTFNPNGSKQGFADGFADQSKFTHPTSVCVDSMGNVYVADSNNRRIRKITKGPKININGVPGLVSASLPEAALGQIYNYNFGVVGTNSTVTWSIVSGALPLGLSFNATSGTLSGMATTLGNYTYRIRLDSGSNWDEVELQHRVELPRVISLSANLSFGSAILNTTTNRTLSITNTGSGNLMVSRITYPSGFSGNWSGSIAPGATQNVTVSFAPAAAQNYSGNLSVNSNATSGTACIALSGEGVPPPPVITSGTSASGMVGSAFSYQITTTINPTSYGATDLPAGLSLNTTTGLISGTPMAAGNSSVNLTATNAGGTGNATLALAVSAPPMVFAWGDNGNGQTTVPAGLSGVTAIAAGLYHTVALKNDGTVLAWGDNGSGQTTVPAGLTGVRAIAPGGSHTVALKNDGTVLAWGRNDAGQATVPAGLSGVRAIAAGGLHTVGLKNDGTVVAWGANHSGQRTIPAGLTGVRAIAAGYAHTVALKNDGTVLAWGANNKGQTNVPGGLSGVRAIAAGFYHTVALKNDGTVVAWGFNEWGQTNVPAGLSEAMAIAAGDSHTVALKNDGTVLAWGSNYSGQRNAPTGLSGVMAIAAGRYHTVALKNDSPKISINDTVPTATRTQPYAFTFGVTSDNAPVTWSVTQGTLPPGMLLNATNGTLSGTPTAAGNYTFVLRLDSGGYWDEVDVVLQVVEPFAIWSEGSGNWTLGFSPSAINSADIIFTGSTGGNSTNDLPTSTLSGIGNLTFNSTAGAFTLAAGPGSAGHNATTALLLDGDITNNSASTQTVNLALTTNATRVFDAAAGNITVGGAIGGTGGISKNGNATLALTGNNTFTGAATVNSGTLAVSNSGALGSASGATVAQDAQLRISGNATINRPLFLNGGSGTDSLGDIYSIGNTTISGHIHAGGDLASEITANNSGRISITGGISGTQEIMLSAPAGATIEVSGNGISTTGAQALETRGAGLVLLNAPNTFTGAIQTDGGNLEIGPSGSLHSGNASNILQVRLGNFTYSGTGNQILSGAISDLGGGPGRIIQNSNSTLTLTGNSTYNGGFAIHSGTLEIGGAGRLGSGNLTGAISLDGTLLHSSSANQVLSGILAGAGSLTKNGTGTLTLSGNNSYTGATTINAGILNLGASDRISNSSPVTISGGTLDIGAHTDTVGAFAITSGHLNGSGTLTATNAYALQGGTINAKLGAGAITVSSGTTTLGSAGRLNTASTLTINSGNLTLGGDETVAALSGSGGMLLVGGKRFTVNQTSDQTFSGAISGAGHGGNGGFFKTGNGTLTLAGSHAYTSNDNLWGFQIYAGNVTLGANDRIASNTVVLHGGALNLSTFNETVDTFYIWGGSLAGTGTLTAGRFYLNGGTVDANLGAGELYVTYNAGGTLLNGTTSATLVTLADDLTLGSANRLALGANVTILSGTLRLGGNETVDRFRIDAGSLAGTGHTLTATNGYALRGGTIGANLGAGTITVTNSLNGPTTLSGTAASTAVNINSGNLTLGAANRLADTAAVTVNATFNLGGFNETIGVLSGNSSGAIILGAGNLVTDSASSGTYAGGISGSGGLAKNGTGTLTLSGNNTYTGATTIHLGTLSITGNTASSATTVGSGGTLTGTGTAGAVVVNSGGLLGAGTGTATAGKLSGSTLTINGGSGYAFTIANISGSGGTAGTDYDQIALTGGLALNNTAANKFTLSLYGTPAGWNGENSYAWDFLTAASQAGFSAGNFTTDFTNFGIAYSLRPGNWTISNPTGGTLRLTYTAAPTITSAAASSATVGAAFSYQITATNNPTGFGASGLPAGLSLNTTTGLISGTPPSPGNFTVNLTATNAGGTRNATLALSVAFPPPVVMVTTLAGSGNASFVDASGSAASFNGPNSVAVDNIGNIYVADQLNHCIRKVSAAGVVTTLAGSGLAGFADGNGTDAGFNYPSGVALDGSGNVYVADSSNHRIRKIAANGTVITLAGSGTAGSADGNSISARFNYPSGLTVDGSGNVYVGDNHNHRIRKITANGTVTTLAGSGIAGSTDGNGTSASFTYPKGVAVDGSGDVYVGDTTRIRKITANATVTTLAGSGTLWLFADGNGTSARFAGVEGVAVDGSGNVYVGDKENNRIRKITANGTVTTLAGNSWGYADGGGTDARFYWPCGVAVDGSGNVYVADFMNHRIRKITIGPKITIAGMMPNATLNQSYAGFTFNATGTNAPVAWSVSEGSPPPGMSLNATTGTLSGTPTAAGTYTFVVRLDSGGYSDEVEVQLQVYATLSISLPPSGLPAGGWGDFYEFQLGNPGGIGPYAWQILSGDLPEGVTLTLDGRLQGIPLESGAFSITTQVTDSLGMSASLQMPLLIAPASNNPSQILGSGIDSGGGLAKSGDLNNWTSIGSPIQTVPATSGNTTIRTGFLMALIQCQTAPQN